MNHSKNIDVETCRLRPVTSTMHEMVVPYSSNVCENSLVQWNVSIHRLPRENVSTMSPALVDAISTVLIFCWHSRCANRMSWHYWTILVGRGPGLSIHLHGSFVLGSNKRLQHHDLVAIRTSQDLAPTHSRSSATNTATYGAPSQKHMSQGRQLHCVYVCILITEKIYLYFMSLSPWNKNDETFPIMIHFRCWFRKLFLQWWCATYGVCQW